jgi:phosphatidylglycerol:prolipoprotein diacylglycerol transferase
LRPDASRVTECGIEAPISRSPNVIVFPNEEFPRHPSQIYEAIFEGLIPFLILFCLNLKFKIFSTKNPGFLTGFFLIFYGFSRFVIEKFWRLPDPNSGYVFFEKFTIGQGFCFTMLIVGLYILIFKWKKKYDCIL